MTLFLTSPYKRSGIILSNILKKLNYTKDWEPKKQKTYKEKNQVKEIRITKKFRKLSYNEGRKNQEKGDQRNRVILLF